MSATPPLFDGLLSGLFPALALVPKGAQQLVAATIRAVFAQPDAPSAREQGRRVADGFRDRFPRLADPMDDAEANGLTGGPLGSIAFPSAHWQQIWLNNPLDEPPPWSASTAPRR